jgi:hypothetical protein
MTAGTNAELMALLARAREYAEQAYQRGQESARKRLDGPWGMSLHQAIERADRTIESLERDGGGIAWTSRGYRDTLVEHRDSVGDV